MTLYNERLIATYNEQTYNNLLSNPSEYISLIAEKMNRFNPNSPARCSRLAKLDALDNYIVKCVLENPSKINKNGDINKYRDYLFNLFKSHPLISMDNILFRKDIATRLFSTDQVREIESYKLKAKNEIQLISEKINKKEQVSKQELNKYLIFLKSQIGNNSQKIITMQDNMFGMLLNDSNPKSLVEKEFMFKYVAHVVAKEHNMPPIEVYISNDYFKGNPYNSPYSMGCSDGNTSIVTINRNNVIRNYTPLKDIDPFIKMIQTIAHESRHSYQDYGAIQGDINYATFEVIRFNLFTKYLTNSQFNEYQKNYSNYEVENDANVYGWTLTTKLLERFNPNMLKNINDTIQQAIVTKYSQTLGEKTDGQTKKTKAQYNVESMDEIIRLHPEELKKYPQLLNFYNPDGTRKSLGDLILSENRVLEDNNTKDNIKEVYDEYYTTIVDRSNISTLDFSILPLDVRFKAFGRITELLTKEIENLSKSITILYKDNVKEFNRINAIRIKRVTKLIDYYNSHLDFINNLIEEDRRLNNKNAVAFSLDILYKKFNNLKGKINKTEVLKETQIYQELTELSEVEYNGPRF